MENNLTSCMAYLNKMPPAQSGAGGHNATLQAALACRRFGLTRDEMWTAMIWYNDNRCDPKWKEHELKHKIDSVLGVDIKKALGHVFKPRGMRKFSPGPAPTAVVDTRPIFQRSEQEEELAWAKWCVDHGTTLEEFDRKVGNA